MSAMSECHLALDEYAEYLFQDFVAWRARCKGPVPTKNDYSIEYMEGRKFLRVVHVDITGKHRSCHSFIVLEADDKFKFGDILKAAGWAAPAKNFARGNVMTVDFGKIACTGA